MNARMSLPRIPLCCLSLLLLLLPVAVFPNSTADVDGLLARAQEFLHAWAQRQRQASAYSIEDIYRADAGKLLIPCLRFTAESGKRGYDVIDSPLVASKGPSGFRVEATSK